MKETERPQCLTPKALQEWIPALAREGKLYKFYKTPEWKALRKQVLQQNHYECEDCRAMSPAKITRATTVHHDKTVRSHPELALSTFWIDAHGQRHQQLWALCEECHNRRHDRFGFEKPKEKPLTPERW